MSPPGLVPQSGAHSLNNQVKKSVSIHVLAILVLPMKNIYTRKSNGMRYSLMLQVSVMNDKKQNKTCGDHVTFESELIEN